MKINTRQKLLKATMELVNEFGLHNTPTSKIAKAAGFSEATIYKNFSSKDELIIEVYLEIKADLNKAFSVGINRDIEFKERTKKALSNYFNYFLSHRDELMYFLQFTNSVYMNKVVHEMGRTRLEYVNQYITENIKNGHIKNMPFAFYEAFVNAPILEIARSCHMGDLEISDELREKVVSNLLDIMLVDK